MYVACASHTLNWHIILKLLHFTSIGDFVDVLLMTMSFYLTVRLAADLIILCWVIHPPTFQPPADGARSLVSSPVKGFYRR